MLAVVFLATLVRSAFGFGEALVAVPLAVALSVTVAGIILLQDWRHVHVGSAWRLVISTFAGIPLGLWLLAALVPVREVRT